MGVRITCVELDMMTGGVEYRIDLKDEKHEDRMKRYGVKGSAVQGYIMTNAGGCLACLPLCNKFIP